MAFAHLHVHTEYSLLDGAARISKLVEKAKELGMKHLAITDHGVMFGVVDFYRACEKEGIKPIIGCEVYTAARGMEDKDSEKDKSQGHLVLLAKNKQGYQNLIKIVSLGFLKGFYYKPRIDKDVLRQYSEGIIALSACLAGDVQRKLRGRGYEETSGGDVRGDLGTPDYEGAKEEALVLREIFGEENFYLELQDQGLEEEAEILPGLLRIHEETGIPLVATNDVHYINQSDARAHDVLLCIQTATTTDAEDRMRFPNDQFYLKSEKEMRTLFANLPQACDNTVKIAEACDVSFDFGQIHLPQFTPPKGKTNQEYLRQLCKQGLEKRYGDQKDADMGSLQERLDYELSVIEKMEYVAYFLIVWDFIKYARQQNIQVGPGRGSAAGSLVSYVLRITDIDPIRYGLIFERFLNPERISMPDIDIDFCYERRQEVIDYVVEKYGEDKVCQIITFGTMKAKAAVRDVGRALNLSYQEADAIAKAIPFSLDMTIDMALQMNPDLKESYENDPKVAGVLDMAKALEGMPRHASTHAAGVVISKESVDHYVPMYLAEKGVSTQFPMTTIEELGLLKMDFLGLRNLTVIRDALELIEKDYGKTIDFAKSGYDDPKVYALIAKGNTGGIFQLESDGMTRVMKDLSPDCFEDIVAGVALYRPGPMASIPTYIENKKNPDKIQYLHESLKPILSVTYGCLIYQEQVMQIVRDLGGYSYGRSDLVRRAMSKKKMDVMLEEKEYFINGKTAQDGTIEIPGCIRRGVPKQIAEAIFNQMVSFAQYAFNKSHAAAYAVIAYETAYLKHYYPTEFMAALLTSVMSESTTVAKYIRNCTDMGIEVLPPDVNESDKKFTVRDGKIRFGLRGVKNVGAGVIDTIIKARREKGLPKDIFQFISNLDIHQVNKKAIESLIRAGALDSLNENRAAHMAIYESLIESAQNSARRNLEGQLSLFQLNAKEMEAQGDSRSIPNVANFDKQTLTAMEKEMLGVYISEHPLAEYADQISKLANVTSEDLLRVANKLEEAEDGATAAAGIPIGGESPIGNVEMQDHSKSPENKVFDGMELTMAGIVTHKKTLLDKNSRMMAFVDMEDLYGEVELVVFSSTYQKYSSLLADDSLIVAKGEINFKEGEVPKLLVSTILDLRIVSESAGVAQQGASIKGGGSSTKPLEAIVKIRIPDELENGTAQVKQLLARHKGTTPVLLYDGEKGKSQRQASHLWVNPSKKFEEEAIALVGRQNVKL